MEALAYLLIDLATGTLPWKKAVRTPGTHEYTVLQMKQQTPVSEMTQGLPACFEIFLNAARALEFT